MRIGNIYPNIAGGQPGVPCGAPGLCLLLGRLKHLLMLHHLVHHHLHHVHTVLHHLRVHHLAMATACAASRATYGLGAGVLIMFAPRGA